MEPKKNITVQIQVHAPPHIVWDYWSNPRHIKKWNAASDDWHTTNAVNDLRKGGHFSFRMESKSTNEGFDFEGIYEAVILDEKIDYILGDGRHVHIHFQKSGVDSTMITETFETEDQNPEEMQREGWQAILNRFKYYVEINMVHPITPCLWFDGQAEEAARFYVSVFKNSSIKSVSYYGKDGHEIHGQKEGTILTVEFEINGQPFTALNGGPEFRFNEAVSFQVYCDTQAEIDFYWDTLTANGGEESYCGWLKDKFGVSWQIVPVVLSELIRDKAKSERVMAAFMQMRKFDIEKLLNA
ncbi:MAG: VOC family protein [Dysgonomonas sp.]|nr:VOC family protein [Dysgonomonas sp.]